MTPMSPRLLVLPVAVFLTACAGMQNTPPMFVASSPPPPEPPTPTIPSTPTQFIADQRSEARQLEANGMLTRARLHWRYVLALKEGDEEAGREIARLEVLIKMRRDAALAQGEAAMMRGRTADAQTAFLKALALDGSNEQARKRLIELETKAALLRQDRKDARTLAQRAAGSESPEN